MTAVTNLFADLPTSQLPEELFEIFASGKAFRLARIISTGQSSPEEGWYDQDEHEWVILLTGAAKILFEDNQPEILLTPGDFLHIPAHQKHRVTWTDPNIATAWLALYYDNHDSMERKSMLQQYPHDTTNPSSIQNLIIVLGSPNTDTGELLTLAQLRLTTAIDVHRCYPGSKFLLTGGFGEHFNKTSQPHAEYARQYLLTQDIPTASILKEVVLSSNTIEDATKAIPLIDQYNPQEIIIVTSDFHLMRARFIFEHVFPNRQIGYVSSETKIPKKELQKMIDHEKKQLIRLKSMSIQDLNQLLQ